jgi:type II secretory pathway predicted ATPase ExeA
MYESFYGFDQRPFLTVPTLDRYFPASSTEAAYQTVTRAIQRCEGPVAIFGGAGLGKTMCCLRIAASLPRSFDVITLASSQLITRRALLQSLLYELRLPCRDGSEGELRLSLLERLQPSEEHPSEGLVLIVDEAQTLSIKLLEELRILTNVIHEGVPRLRLVLCGTLRLEDTLAHPHLESLNQRLAARCYLTPLNHDESDRYVQHKIELCGQRVEEVITLDGLEAIYRAADGIPRLIDQVADQALLQGAKEKIVPINAAVVGYAWSLLQQLPNPWSDALPGVASYGHASDSFAPEDSEESEVEFGSLEESSDTAPSVCAENSQRPEAYSPRFFDDTDVPSQSDPITENLFASFAQSSKDEFPIPIQSLRGYHNLSGVAPGELNHDTLGFDEVQKTVVSESLKEARDFIGLAPSAASQSSTPRMSATSPTGSRPTPFGVSNSDLGALEKQIESEMRHLVSDLNAEAIREHFESVETHLGDDLRSPSDPYQEPDPAQGPLGASSFGGRSNVMDDRDLITVVDRLEEDRQDWNGVHGGEGSWNAPSEEGEPQPAPPTSKAAIHPYARLFSQLRSS